jgi:ribose transport system ATP-binding protein
VLKDGGTVTTGLSAKETPTGEIIRLMTGRAIEYVFPQRPGVEDAAPLLEVDGLTRAGEFSDVTFSVRPGEVLGLAGLVGAGRSEILETVFGARRPDAGTVKVDGKPVRPGSVDSAVRAGIGLCPEERKSQALLLGESVATNISMASLTRFARAGFLDRRAERRAAAEVAGSLELRPAGVDREMRTLSGGNQQKVVLARWLLRDCRVLLLDEPTRGVDVGARSEIYALVRQLADKGVAVVVVSSEIEEVLGLADHVLGVGDGAVLAQGPATELTEHDVLDIIMRGDAA